MDQLNNACAVRRDHLTHVGQGNGVASMKKQRHIGSRQFLGNCAANSTAGARDKITFHVTQASCLIVRQAFSLPSPGKMPTRQSQARCLSYVLLSVNRLFAVSHKRNRISCWSRRLSIFGQSARTIFSPVEGASRKSSVSRSRCRSCHGASESPIAFLNATKSWSVPLRLSYSPPMVVSVTSRWPWPRRLLHLP